MPVYADPYAPVISSAIASPSAVPHAGQTTQLSATTSDADGDTVTHWWTVKTAPAGAKPVFDTHGHAATNVSGLTVAGTYTFTVSAIDHDPRDDPGRDGDVGAPLPGDINIDGAVNVVDLQALVAAWASQATPPSPNWNVDADLNIDGYVNVGDLQILVVNWGNG